MKCCDLEMKKVGAKLVGMKMTCIWKCPACGRIEVTETIKDWPNDPWWNKRKMR